MKRISKGILSLVLAITLLSTNFFALVPMTKVHAGPEEQEQNETITLTINVNGGNALDQTQFELPKGHTLYELLADDSTGLNQVELTHSNPLKGIVGFAFDADGNDLFDPETYVFNESKVIYVLWGDLEPIEEVEVEIEPPTIGDVIELVYNAEEERDVPNITPIVNYDEENAHIGIGEPKWVLGVCGEDDEHALDCVTPYTGEIEEGKTYYASIGIGAEDGYAFPMNVAFTVNGDVPLQTHRYYNDYIVLIYAIEAEEGEPQEPGDDPQNPPQPQYSIQIAPSGVDFGTVTEGFDQDVERNITIQNTGTDDVAIYISCPQGPFSVQDFTDGTVVQANGSTTVTLIADSSFNAAAGNYNGTYTIGYGEQGEEPVGYIDIAGSLVVQQAQQPQEPQEPETPAISVSPTSVDFGTLAVGWVNDVQRTVTVTNNTTDKVIEVSIDVPTADGPFGVLNSNSATLQPGANTTFTLIANHNADEADDPDTYNGTYVFNYNEEGSLLGDFVNVTATVTIEAAQIPQEPETPGEAPLVASTNAVNFNSVAEDFSEDVERTVTLTNNGAYDLVIDIETPDDAIFGIKDFTDGEVLPSGQSLEVKLIADSTSQNKTAGEHSGRYTVSFHEQGEELGDSLEISATLTITEATPQEPETPIETTSISAVPMVVEFGTVTVGWNTDVEKTVTISNTGNTTVEVSVTSPTTGPFGVKGTSTATIEAGANTTFTLIADHTAASASTANDYNANYTFTYNKQGDENTSILSVGATLTVQAAQQPEEPETPVETTSISVAPTSVDFGTQTVGWDTDVERTITVTNTGNTTVEVSVISPDGPFGVKGTATATIEAGNNTTFTLIADHTADEAATADDYSGNYLISYNKQGELLGNSETVAATLTIEAAQQPEEPETPVETTSISVAPTSVDFGTQTVGWDTDVERTITVTNTGNTTVEVSVISPDGPFGVKGTATATIEAGNNTTFTLIADHTATEAATADDYSGNFVVTYNKQGAEQSSTTNVAATLTIQAAQQPEDPEDPQGGLTILDGNNQNVDPETDDDGITIRASGSLSDLQKILVDGQEITDEDGDTTEGSTILTLKPEFLRTLSAGQHTVEFVFTSGSVSAVFTIAAAATNNTPTTTNPSTYDNIMNWVGLLAVSTIGAGVGIIALKKTAKKSN